MTRILATSSGGSASALIVTEVDGAPSGTPSTLKFSNGSVTDNGDGSFTVTTGAGGGGDFSSNTSTSVDSEIVLFSGTGGKTGKRATGTGIATLTSGVLSATATTGSGSVVLATSATLVTPILGVAAATTINKVTITAPATGSTLTIDDGFTLHATGNVTALSGSHTGTSSGTNTGDQTITLTGGVTGSGTGSFAATVITNANLTGPITSVGNATSIASQTGTGTKFVVDTSPTLVTPILGVATATSINKMAITAPATSSTLAVADGKTFTVNNTLTLAGTDATTMTFPTTSATIARTDAANTFTGHQTIEGVTSTGATGTGKFVFDTSPTLVTPTIGAAVGTSLTLSAPGTSSTDVPNLTSTNTFTNKRITKRVITVADGTTITPNADTSDFVLQLNTQAGGTLTVANPTGTPTDRQPLNIQLKSTNVQTFSFGTQYRGSTDLALVTASTGSSKWDRMGFEWNANDTKWDLVAKNFGY